MHPLSKYIRCIGVAIILTPLIFSALTPTARAADEDGGGVEELDTELPELPSINIDFNAPLDRVFGFEPGRYNLTISINATRGNNILFLLGAYSPESRFNCTIDIRDPIGRNYSVVGLRFRNSARWSTDFGCSTTGPYIATLRLDIETPLSLHIAIYESGPIINEFYPAHKIGDLFYDYRVFNESVTKHEFYIPMDSDTEYTFNFIRVTPISKLITDRYYSGGRFPAVNGSINMEGIRFDLWNNISTAGYKQENAAFKALIGSFTNGTVKFTVEMSGVYTNMVFLFQSYSTQRIGDGPDPMPPSPNATANNSIDEVLNNAQEATFKFMFNDSVILIATIVLLISGLFIYLKAQSTVYILE